MNYTIELQPEGTAILSIESSLLLEANRKLEIWRYYPKSNTTAAKSAGAVIGRKPGSTCALIVHVRPDDLIGIREKLDKVDTHRWRYFHIACDFSPIALHFPNRRISQDECLSLLRIKKTDELSQIDFTDEALQEFLAFNHPEWLQVITNRQIKHWKHNKPDKFFRLAPVAQAGKNIALCVEQSPHASLARFLDRLDEAQLSQCITKCPKSAAMYALNLVSAHKRKKLLANFPMEALLFSAAILTDSEVALCAKSDLFFAFRVRNKVAPRHHAILLAHSYLIANPTSSGGSWIKLQEEVRHSLLEFPEQWRAADPYGFPSIFSGLESYLGMKHEQILIRALLENAMPADRQDIADYVALSV